MKTICAIFLTTAVVNAFTPSSTMMNQQTILQSTKNSFDPLNISNDDSNVLNKDTISVSMPKIAAASAAVFALHPLSALAEEVDDYQYGAVNAPIGLAWGAGVLAILTALVPVLLKGGEEAFEEMREQEADTWGSGNRDKLKRKKR
mmetsp:Transcript_9240/g.11657  ORF Transcript_9240/g.11657 Transcript_9240/m.11657 type:complete len:146 (+) Transcript_9240:62-499(+)